MLSYHNCHVSRTWGEIWKLSYVGQATKGWDNIYGEVDPSRHHAIGGGLQSVTNIMGKPAVSTISRFYPLPPLNNIEKK